MIEKNIAQITKEIHNICIRCGRDPEEIRLVAISKTYPPEAIQKAYEAGIKDFGENRVQELMAKMDPLPDDITWHMVGRIQSNKIKDMVHRIGIIHSISKIKYLKELDKRAATSGRNIRILIQVNISSEEQKDGCEPADLGAILEYATTLSHVSVIGLMGMATLTGDRELIRKQFRSLRIIRDNHRSYESGPVSLHELSMGMSKDFGLAIEEGATIIRLGTALFGKRRYIAQDH